MNRVWALVPLKTLTCAKSRLATTLGPAGRRTLALAMVRDVVGALVGSSSIARVVMVSDVPELARLMGIDGLWHFDTRRALGLNEDLTAAAAWAGTQGATHALIAHGDLPWLTPQAVDRFVLGAEAELTSRVRAAACKENLGTNLLLVPLPLPLPLVFGRDSLARFAQAATIGDVGFDVVRDASLAGDIDGPGDLAALCDAWANGEPIGRHTVRLLGSLSQATFAGLPPLGCRRARY